MSDATKRFIFRCIIVFGLGVTLGVLVGCAPADRTEQPPAPISEIRGIFTRLDVGASTRGPVMHVMDWEGHQYLTIGNGIEEGFILHSESCPHRSHPGLGEIY